MNKMNGKNKVKQLKIDLQKDNNVKNAKTITSAFIGSYNYMQPGRSTQYDIGTDNYNGLTDIPVYIALMNEKNGGCLYFPTNLK
jgi:HKD family nuclease